MKKGLVTVIRARQKGGELVATTIAGTKTDAPPRRPVMLDLDEFVTKE